MTATKPVRHTIADRPMPMVSETDRTNAAIRTAMGPGYGFVGVTESILRRATRH